MKYRVSTSTGIYEVSAIHQDASRVQVSSKNSTLSADLKRVSGFQFIPVFGESYVVSIDAEPASGKPKSAYIAIKKVKDFEFTKGKDVNLAGILQGTPISKSSQSPDSLRLNMQAGIGVDYQTDVEHLLHISSTQGVSGRVGQVEFSGKVMAMVVKPYDVVGLVAPVDTTVLLSTYEPE